MSWPPLNWRRSLLSGVALAIGLNFPNANIKNSRVIKVQGPVKPEIQMASNRVKVAVWTPPQRIGPGTCRDG